MADSFDKFQPGLSSPADHAAVVTPSDSTDLPNFCRGLYVGVTGNVAVVTTGGSTVTFYALNAGCVLPVRVARVLATGTTATNLVALW